MIKQISFIPFDLGFIPDFEKIKKLNTDNFDLIEISQMEKNLIGMKILSFKSTDNEKFIYLNKYGFGIFVTTVHVYDNLLTPSEIPKLLYDRRNSHCNLISGKKDTTKIIFKFIEDCKLSLDRKSILREPVWNGIPYVMSVYLCNQSIDILQNEESRKTLIALIEPSSVGIEDTGFIEVDINSDKYIRKVYNIDTGKYKDLLNDIEVDTTKSCFMSWANVVCLGENVFLDEKIYASLEVRTQLAWTMSYYTNLWCEYVLDKDQENKDIEQHEWNLTKIYQQADKLIDSSIATRYQNLFNEMIRTSMLQKQIEKAKQSLEYLNKYSLYLKTKSQKKYTFVIECAIFTLAFIQSVPLFFQLPFFQGNDILYFQIGYIALFVSFIALYYMRAK